ncbi:MAG: HAD hydrolase-like protein [Myxococcota bacterium]
MRFRLAIFDFDGTLADSFPWFLSIINSVADEYGFRRIAAEQVDAVRKLGAREILEQCRIPLWKTVFIARRMRILMGQQFHAVAPFPGVPQVLAELARQGVTLALVTSNSLENVQRVLGPETTTLIRHRECSVSVFGKSARVRRVMRASGVSPSETILIGDEVRDAEAARQAGVAFGAVSWGYNHVDALRAWDPHALFTRVEDIADAVMGSGSAS